MKTITSGFKEQITKLGREIDFQFFLHTNDKLITEDSKFIMTQANAHLVVEQFDDEEIDEIITAEDIYSVSIINRGEILSTMMKELDFEIAQDLRIGDVIECQFGLKVGEDYEYVNYGKYMVYEKEYNEDTKTYSYVAYDRMMLTMQDVSQEFLTDLEGRTLANSINVICGQVGLSYNASQQELADYPNLNKQINEGTFTNLQMTYRDVLDIICQALGLSMIINPDDKHLLLKSLNNTPVDTFDEQFLKDTNVSFGEKYGPINSVVLSRSEDFDTIYRRDEESISENGLHEYKIKDNLIMLYDDREDYIDEIFEQLNGLEYYPTDFSSTGITYLDWLDFYNVTIGDKTYKCLMLDDEIEINQGLEENIYSEEPIESVTNYKTSSKTDKEVSFIVDKQNGNIKAKVSKGEVINEINLDESGASINANKVNIQASDVLNILAGNSINLTSKDITINSTNFNVDENGNLTCSNANITGGQMNVIKQAGSGSVPFIKVLDNHYNGNITTEVLTAIIELNNYATDMGAMIEPQVRMHSNIYGNTTLGAGGCYSPEFVQTSLEESKKNFEKLESGLNILKKIDIYKYNLKSQDDNEKKHIGFVIGDKYKYTKEITSSNNDGVDIYSFVSVCCKAIQEQQEQIETLKKEIKQLKESDK